MSLEITPEVQPSFLNRLGTVAKVAGNEIKSNNYRNLPILAGMALAEFYEWGPLNEMVMGIAGAKSLESGNPSILVGAKTGAIALATQVVVGTVAAASVRTMPETMHSVRSHFFDESTENFEPGLASKFMTGFNYGTSTVILGEHHRKHNRTKREDAKTIAGSAAMTGVAVLGIAAAASKGVEVAQYYNQPEVGDWVVRILTNPLTYIAPDLALRLNRWRIRHNAKKVSTEQKA